MGSQNDHFDSDDETNRGNDFVEFDREPAYSASRKYLLLDSETDVTSFWFTNDFLVQIKNILGKLVTSP